MTENGKEKFDGNFAQVARNRRWNPTQSKEGDRQGDERGEGDSASTWYMTMSWRKFCTRKCSNFENNFKKIFRANENFNTFLCKALFKRNTSSEHFYNEIMPNMLLWNIIHTDETEHSLMASRQEIFNSYRVFMNRLLSILSAPPLPHQTLLLKLPHLWKVPLPQGKCKPQVSGNNKCRTAEKKWAITVILVYS